MRAAHSNLQRQNTMYSHKKYVILQHLLLMQIIAGTTWGEGAKRLCFTCGARDTQALNSLSPVHWLYRIRYQSMRINSVNEIFFSVEAFFFISRKIGFLSKFLLQTKKNRLHSLFFG